MEVVLPISVDGSFGFCPRASSDENPLTFASEFLAFRHQDKARSNLQLVMVMLSYTVGKFGILH